MRPKKIIPILFFCSISILKISGQATDSIKPLTIGDTIPDLVFDSIINYHISKARLSDFKGKLVILDFWSRDCGSCIADFPRKNELQRKNAKKVLILPVNDEKDGMSLIPTFWKTNEITKKLSLPTVIDPKIKIGRFFSRPGAGLQVWIDEKRIIRGLTTEEYVNENEIRKILNKEEVKWPIWKRIEFDYSNGILADSGITDVKKCKFMSHLEYVPSYISSKIEATHGDTRFLAVNISIIGLYNFCFQQLSGLPLYENRRVLRTNDSTRFFQKDSYLEDWWVKNTYCYEKRVPSQESKLDFAMQMKLDLDSCFNIQSGNEEKEVECLVLKKQRTLSAKEMIELKNGSSFSYSLKEFVHDLNSNSFSNLPILSDTELSSENDLIYMPILYWNDRKKLDDVIFKNGFKLIREKRKILFFVMKDKN